MLIVRRVSYLLPETLDQDMPVPPKKVHTPPSSHNSSPNEEKSDSSAPAVTTPDTGSQMHRYLLLLPWLTPATFCTIWCRVDQAFKLVLATEARSSQSACRAHHMHSPSTRLSCMCLYNNLNKLHQQKHADTCRTE